MKTESPESGQGISTQKKIKRGKTDAVYFGSQSYLAVGDPYQ